MKKILAVVLAMVMCLGILAACGDATEPPVPPTVPGGDGNQGGGGGGDAAPGGRPAGAAERQALAEEYGLPYFPETMDAWEPIEFTYWVRNPGSEPLASNPIISIIEQITNTKIIFDYLVGDFDQAFGIMRTGVDVPDMLFVGGEADKIIETGFVMPLEDLIEQYAPNLRELYDPFWNRMRSPDGKIYTANIYGVPTGDQFVAEQNDTAFWLQKAVVDEFGPPKDVYEFFEFIRLYKEKYPTIDGITTLGFEFDPSVNYLTLMNPGSFLDGNQNWGQYSLHLGGQRMGDPFEGATPRYPLESEKEWYLILNKAHKDGLINPETFTRSQDEYLERIANGVVLGLQDQRWNFNSGGMDPLRQQDRFERTYVSFDFTWEGIEPNYWDMRTFTGLNGINFGNDNKDPVRAIQYLDYMVHEEVQRFMEWGIEGEHYFYNAEGRIERPQEQRDLQADPRWPIDNLGRELRNYMPKLEGSYPSDGNPTSIGQSREEYFLGIGGWDKEFFERHGIMSEAGFMRGTPQNRPVYGPFWSMTLSRSQQTIGQQIRDVLLDYLPKLILTSPDNFDALWDEYKAALAVIDMQPIIDAINEQALERIERAGGE